MGLPGARRRREPHSVRVYFSAEVDFRLVREVFGNLLGGELASRIWNDVRWPGRPVANIDGVVLGPVRPAGLGRQTLVGPGEHEQWGAAPWRLPLRRQSPSGARRGRHFFLRVILLLSGPVPVNPSPRMGHESSRHPLAGLIAFKSPPADGDNTKDRRYADCDKNQAKDE